MIDSFYVLIKRVDTFCELNNGKLALYFSILCVIVAIFYKLLKRFYSWGSCYFIGQTLPSYYSKSLVSNINNVYIDTKCQNINPTNAIEFTGAFAFITKEKIVPFFVNKVFSKESDNKFYLILADSGMGKTTFLLKLFLEYKRKIPFFSHKPNINIVPLGLDFERIKRVILDIQNKENTILLLDALDESQEVGRKSINEILDDIINLSVDFKYVVITCRTQFFSNEKEEPNELKVKIFNTDGNKFYSMKKIYISPFDSDDISLYVRKTFRFFELEKMSQAHAIINQTKDLFVRPMLLSHIKHIVQYWGNPTNEDVKSYQIYDILIFAWIERESNKYDEKKRQKFKSNLLGFTFAIADHIYTNFNRTGLFVELETAVRIANSYEIDLNEIEIKSRSLLNRNDSGMYKFSHKSIFEFILALMAFKSRKFNRDKELYIIDFQLDIFDASRVFFTQMQLDFACEFRLPVTILDSENTRFIKDIYIAKKLNNPVVLEWVDSDKYMLFDFLSNNSLDVIAAVQKYRDNINY